mmetsp:Transcript_79564/g.223166  ORF Transcript_79564/g.223166 Transcript_79564/m.223166 type:complete len:96 (+) Transcript_79564:162-449(+)
MSTQSRRLLRLGATAGSTLNAPVTPSRGSEVHRAQVPHDDGPHAEPKRPINGNSNATAHGAEHGAPEVELAVVVAAMAVVVAAAAAPLAPVIVGS